MGRGRDYSPYRLPDRINFHKATADLPLPQSAKKRFQLALSKMTRQQIEEQIKILEQMRNEKLQAAGQVNYKGPLVIPKSIAEPEKKTAMQMAIWCEGCRQFAEKYLISLKAQAKI